jgi:hypothetical protein
MCYSYNASLIALTAGLFGSTLIYNLGSVDNKIFGLFFGYVSLMQGIEAILWKHQSCDDFHKSVTSAGMLLNMSQPIFLLFASQLFYPSNKNTHILYITALFYILYEIYHFVDFQKASHCTSPQENNPHLVWSWLNTQDAYITWIVYSITLFIMFAFGMTSFERGVTIGSAGVITALLSATIYPGRSAGSIWCFFSALVPMSYLMWKYLSRTWH